MSKDTRIVIRLDTAIDAWLGEQAALRGMDKAAFARMILYERRNGMAAAVAPVPPEEVARMPVDELVGMEDEPVQEAADPAVFDDLLAQRLAEAEQQGLTALSMLAVEPDEDAEAYQELGVRPFRRAAPASYGTMSPPITRQRV